MFVRVKINGLILCRMGKDYIYLLVYIKGYDQYFQIKFARERKTKNRKNAIIIIFMIIFNYIL